MFRDQFHILYMVGLEVVCVLFYRISGWTDSFLLNSLQNSVDIYVLKGNSGLYQSCVRISHNCGYCASIVEIRGNDDQRKTTFMGTSCTGL